MALNEIAVKEVIVFKRGRVGLWGGRVSVLHVGGRHEIGNADDGAEEIDEEDDDLRVPHAAELRAAGRVADEQVAPHSEHDRQPDSDGVRQHREVDVEQHEANPVLAA